MVAFPWGLFLNPVQNGVAATKTILDRVDAHVTGDEGGSIGIRKDDGVVRIKICSLSRKKVVIVDDGCHPGEKNRGLESVFEGHAEEVGVEVFAFPAADVESRGAGN